uniref:Hepcidin n=1 Tax=Poecilia reticulata TaxID=8081 RepID=A0A3P9PK95_POERE
MKTFAVAVTVSLLLTFLCVQENSAVPADELRGLEVPTDDGSRTADQETPEESWNMPYDMRENNYPGPVRCRFCCGCCLADVCGLCCD